MKNNILLVGFGYMGGAMAQGLLAQGWEAASITAIDPTPQAKTRAAVLGIGYHEAPTTPPKAGVVILAVKPQNMAEVASMAQAALAPGGVIISIAAGITLAVLHNHLNTPALVCAMPNTPASIGQGVTACVASPGVTPAQRAHVTLILQAIGVVCWLDDESLMNAVTAVSGSGPAYFFLLMEALEEAAIAAGLPAAVARTLVLKTAAGAGALAWEQRGLRSAVDQGVAVTSPGGTTEAGLAVLHAADFKNLIKRVVEAAKKKAETLK